MNTMRHELVFETEIKTLSKEVIDKFVKETKEKLSIVVLRVETSGRSLIVFTKGFSLGKKDLQSLINEVRNDNEPIKVYIEDDVQDFYHSNTWR